MHCNRKFGLVFLLLVALTATAISACSPLIIAGGVVGTGAFVAIDRRNIEDIVEDQAIEMRVTEAIYADPILTKQVRISVTSYNGIVLLTGEAPTEEMREHSGNVVYAVRNVREVYNEILVKPKLTGEESAHDAWLTTKAKTLLIGARGFPTRTKVITASSIVYLMGLAKGEEAQKAKDALDGMSGVKEVVALFEPLDESMKQMLQQSAAKLRQAPRRQPEAVTEKPKPAEEDDVEILPYKIEKPAAAESVK
jgi:osmotically-inducible protein OsmY